MLRKLFTAALMAVTASAMSAVMLAPSPSAVEAGPICVAANMSEPIDVKVGPHCVPFDNGVNCQNFTAQFLPYLDASVDECIPRP